MKYYEFLFYNFIKLWKKKKDEVENAPINAIITITFFTYLNLITLLLIIFSVFGRVIFDFQDFNKWNIIYFLIGLGIINYIILMRKGKYKKIVNRFNKLDFKLQKVGYRFTIAYLIASLLLPFTIMIFTIPN